MKTALAILLILTGCSSITPKMHPVKPKLHDIKKCGRLKYERKNGNVILDYKAAKCLSEALTQCGQDRRVLISANKANVEQMELMNDNSSESIR